MRGRFLSVLVALVLMTSAATGCAALDRSGSDDEEPPIPEEVDDEEPPIPEEVEGEGAGDEGADEDDDEPLVAAFSWTISYEETGTTSCPVLDITFTDESEGVPTEWRWVFDDGTTSTEQNPVVSGEVDEATLTVTRGEETDTVTEEIFYDVC